MSKKFLVNINMGGNQIVSPVLNNPVIFGYSANQANVTGAMYYNTTTNLLNYYNGTSWVALTTGGSAVTALNSFTGPVTIAGTSNQIAVSSATNTITLSLPSNVTLPGKTTLTASTTSASSLNIPAATSAPSSPAVGDIWTTASTGANILYYNGATKTVAFTDSNITGSAGSVANSLTIGNGLTVAGPYNGSAAVTVSLPSTITAGSVGSSSAIPVITYDTYGRITAVSTASISSSISLAGQTGTGSVSTGGTLTITNGSGITTSASGSTFTITNSGVLSINGSTGAVTGIATTAGNLSQFASTTSAQLAGVLSDETGTGSVVFSNSPTLVTPALGTPSSVTLTNATGLPISTGVSGLGTGIATFLATPSSANLASAVTDETGSGALVFANTPTLVTPVLGVATATSINGLTISTTTGTLTLANGSTLATSGSNSITLTSTGATNVTLPTSGTLATTAYVDAAVTGLNVHAAVELATTTTLAGTYTAGTTGADGGTGVGAYITASANGAFTIDSYASTGLEQYDRILVKDGITADSGTGSKANGIYYFATTADIGSVSTPWKLTRATDADNHIAGQVIPGDFVFVQEGTINGGNGFVLTSEGTSTTPVDGIKIGTDSITFTQFSGTGEITAGTGLTKSGNTLSITTITQSNSTSSALTLVNSATINTTGQVTGQTTSALGTEFTNTSGTIALTAASIANSKLTNSSITIGSSSPVSLGSTIGASGSAITGLYVTLPTIGGTGANFSGSTSGTITLKATATAGTNTITLPAVTGTVITTGDSGTVTNTMLANSTISGVALGSNLNALSYGTGLTNTSGASTYNGSATSTIGFATGTTTQTGSGVSGGTYSYATQKQVATITGNGSLTSFAVNHNLNSQDIQIQVYQTSATPDTQYSEVEVDIVRTSTSVVTVTFATAPASGVTYNVVMVG